MVKLAMHLLVIVTTVQSFFLSNRDLRRIFRFIPRAYNAIDKDDRHFHHNSQCHHHHPDHHHYHHMALPADYHHHAHHDGYYHHDDDYHNHYPGTNRQDAEDLRTGCKRYHSDSDYDESDRRTNRRHGTNSKSHKEKTTNIEKHAKNKDEIPGKIYKASALEDDALEDRIEKDMAHLNFKKDYVAGVLVTIPKIEYDPSIENYFHRTQYLNPFFGTYSGREAVKGKLYDPNNYLKLVDSI